MKKLLHISLTAFMTVVSMSAYALDKKDGVYQIGTAQNLKDFANIVNGGEFGANAVLTADIALKEVWETPIGTNRGAYTGIFDGQGHKITGFEGTSNGMFGLFGLIRQATVQNFCIVGKLKALSSDGEAAHGAGTIGWSEGSHISGVHSELEITVADPNVHHVGGVIGSAQYNNVIRCCSFSGSLSEQYGNTDSFGGVVGYMGNDSIINCANYGSVSFFAPNAYAGGILGYLNNTEGTIKSCLNTGKIAYSGEGDPSFGGAIVGRLRSNTPSRLHNNVWLEGSAIVGTGENKVPTTMCATIEQLANGEICFFLNDNQSEINWFQTLQVDPYPVLDNHHLPVLFNNGFYFNENSNIIFADANVEALCVANWDTNKDGELSYAEAAAVTSLGDVFLCNTSIKTFDELKYFTGLTSIDANAFYSCGKLKTVSVPNSVTIIEKSSFMDCTSLKSISLPNSITVIDDGAFYGCPYLKTITLPSSITTIGENAFEVCTGLTSIVIPASVINVGRDAFRNCI